MDGDEVVARLTRRFGLGSRRDLREGLYRQLGDLVEEKGEAALAIIASVIADTDGKTDKGRYFAFSVKRRLRDRGILPPLEL